MRIRTARLAEAHSFKDGLYDVCLPVPNRIVSACRTVAGAVQLR